MKKKIAIIMTLTMAVSAAAPAFAAANWRSGTLDSGLTVEYNTETHEVISAGSKTKTSDTAVASTTKFTDLVIPEKVNDMTITAIGERGFMDYDEYSSITLPSSLKKIGTSAFWGCDSFSSISIPDGVKEIGDGAFESCDKLSTVKFGSKLATLGQRAFKNCKLIKKISLPDSVTTIGTGAFENCKELSEIDLGSSLTTLGDGAFKGCSSLKTVTLPKGIETLKSNTFDSCTSLESVTLPDGLRTIDNAVFGNCKALRKIYIPATVKTIAKTAFDGCPDVTIYCKKGTAAQEFATANKYTVEIADSMPSDKEIASRVVPDEVVPDHITVIVNDQTVDFKNAQPVIVDSRTLVPMRDIFEALGIVVGWDAETKTVTGKKGVTDISLTIGQSKVYINGTPQPIDVPAQIINGSTMVPLRVISDSVGCRISWDQSTKTANIVD